MPLDPKDTRFPTVFPSIQSMIAFVADNCQYMHYLDRIKGAIENRVDIDQESTGDYLSSRELKALSLVVSVVQVI